VLTWVETEPGESAPSAWVLEVRDNGRGFASEHVPDRGPRRHFGLRFMRERARLVGATLDISSHTDGGTTVRLQLDPRERSYE
jgi:signal transduction histidine kinase